MEHLTHVKLILNATCKYFKTTFLKKGQNIQYLINLCYLSKVLQNTLYSIEHKIHIYFIYSLRRKLQLTDAYFFLINISYMFFTVTKKNLH